MSLWQYAAATGGFAKANTPEEQQGISTAEAQALMASLDRAPSWVAH